MRLNIFLLITLFGAIAQATTFTFNASTFFIRTPLKLDSVVTFVFCATDYWRGDDSDYQRVDSRFQMGILSPTNGGYMVAIPEHTVDFTTFARKFVGCDLILTQLQGKDPELNLPLENVFMQELTIGFSRKSTTDSSDLISSTQDYLKSCTLGGSLSDNSRASRPTWFCN